MAEIREMIPVDEVSIQQILLDLLDGEKNLDLKSQINKPKELASLIVISNHLKNNGYLKSADTIQIFIDKYLRYMVSYNRKSRDEIINAVSNPNREIVEKEKPITSID